MLKEFIILNIKTTKSLKMYSRMGTESKSIRPFFDVILSCSDIRTEHKLPFALMVANCFMNGGVPAGFRGKAGTFVDVKTCKESFLEDPKVIINSYKKTKSGTLTRWSQAIEMVNDGLHLTSNFSKFTDCYHVKIL